MSVVDNKRPYSDTNKYLNDVNIKNQLSIKKNIIIPYDVMFLHNKKLFKLNHQQ